MSARLLMATATTVLLYGRDPGPSSDGLPGIADVAVPAILEAGYSVALRAGFGYSGSVLQEADSHERAFASAALAAIFEHGISFALQVDGRYDHHSSAGSGSDDGFVAEPRFISTLVSNLDDNFTIGARGVVWIPSGASGPSLALSAASPELSAMIAATPHSLPLTLAANAGIRWDRSASSISGSSSLSRADRLAAGVSDSSAFLARLGGAYELDDWTLLAAWSWALHFGDRAPPIEASPMVISAGARLALDDARDVEILFTASPSVPPSFDATSPLVPVEPRFAVVARFGFQSSSMKERPSIGPPPKVFQRPSEARASLRGQVRTRDIPQVPIESAHIVVRSGTITVGARTDANGAFAFAALPRGRAEVEVSADGYEPAEHAVLLESARTSTVAFELTRALAESELRGTIRSFEGKGLAARLVVEPIGMEITSDALGSFRVTISPGEYDVTIHAEGYVSQRRHARVEPEGVTFLNVDLHRGP